jgi:hypothetical protein
MPLQMRYVSIEIELELKATNNRYLRRTSIVCQLNTPAGIQDKFVDIYS